MTRLKSVISVRCFCALVLATIVCSGTFGIRIGNQLANASLLDGDVVSQPNDFEKQLLNETSNGPTNDQGTSSNEEQTGQLQPQGSQLQQQQTPGNDNGVGAEQIPKSQSDMLMQELKDSQLIDRILPVILKRINLTMTYRDSGRVSIPPSGVGINSQFYTVKADCKKDEIVAGGGYKEINAAFMYVPWSFKDGNSWSVRVWVPDNSFGPLKWPNNVVPNGLFTVYVECLKLELK